MFTAFVFLASVASGYRILVYNPRYAHSHSTFVGSIADRLVEAGYNVTTLIPELFTDGGDGTTKSTIIRIPADEEARRHMQKSFGLRSGGHFDMSWFLADGDAFGRASVIQCNKTLNQPGLVEMLTAQKFDVFITENIDQCGIGLSHLIGARSVISVSTSSLWEYDAYALGLPTTWSYNPSQLTCELDVRSLASRASNIINWAHFYLFFMGCGRYTQQLFRERYGPDYPSFQTLIARSAYVFTNSDPLIEVGRPTLRKIVDLGGISVRESNPINSSLAQFPEVTFIWKYEKPNDEFAKEHISKVPNVVLAEWTPQSDLLGVPGMYIPLFGEQPRNAIVMERNGLGVVYPKHHLGDTPRFTQALRDFMNNERLRSNAKTMARKLANRPFSPRDLLLKHVEFAAMFGPSEAMTPEGINLSFIQYHNLDLFFVIFLATVITALIVLYTTIVTFQKLRRILTIKKKSQ